jgi:uncharacterized membrane protein YeaQ/YmgE (transglycosylase-associated protein family)
VARVTDLTMLPVGANFRLKPSPAVADVEAARNRSKEDHVGPTGRTRTTVIDAKIASNRETDRSQAAENVLGQRRVVMADPNLMQITEQAAHDLLVWVGFGTLVGLAAKAIMPGRDPGGAIGTMLMGIGGSLIGCGVLLLFNTSYRITPISPLGFLAGTAGAFLLLLFYRILSNSYVVEAQDGRVPLSQEGTVTYYRKRRRRAA